jgi:dolichol-phosphate mannosyltransferase
MVAVIIPCYKVKDHILDVISTIGPSHAQKIYIVDDKCPENSGQYVLDNCHDGRVTVLFHSNNQGVGAAVMSGYKKAFSEGYSIAVKIDGDGQMDPELIPLFTAPILNNKADYTKGNRFFFLEGLVEMPKIRLIGNAALSFINKIVSGYYTVMDPTNGYTAINLNIIPDLSLEKISKRYFFESDMLFRLNIARAVIQDIPMYSKYGTEESNLNIKNTIITFPPMYFIRFCKRIFYNYFLRDFNLGSVSLTFGLVSMSFGVIFGAYNWIYAWMSNTSTPSGTIMLAALPIIIGFQTLLFFLQQDIASSPKR